tara:strand:+ start:217 stop:342 length:126 start_codon:yes stop_codon:yes gene_type:complete
MKDESKDKKIPVLRDGVLPEVQKKKKPKLPKGIFIEKKIKK